MSAAGEGTPPTAGDAALSRTVQRTSAQMLVMALLDPFADFLEELPAQFIEVRRARARTMRQVQKATGVSVATLQRIETGQPCTTTTAVKLLRWMAS